MSAACPACETPYAPTDFDARSSLSTCRFCGSTASGTSPPPQPTSPWRSPPTRTWSWQLAPEVVEPQPPQTPRPPLPMPAGFVVEDLEQGRRVAWGPVGMTSIALECGIVHIRHRNLVLADQTLGASEIAQLYVMREMVCDDDGDFLRYTYSLRALLTDGHESLLLSGLLEPSQALFLEQEVERWLGIEDVHVPGSYHGTEVGTMPQTAVPCPAGWTCIEGEDALHIAWDWRLYGWIGIALFAVAFNACVVVLFSEVLAGGASGWIYAVLLLFAAAGLLVIWVAIAARLNRTVIEAEYGVIRVTHGPVPIRPDHVLNVPDLVRFEVRDTSHQLPRGRAFELYAILNDGQEIELLRVSGDMIQVLFLKERLDRFCAAGALTGA